MEVDCTRPGGDWHRVRGARKAGQRQKKSKHQNTALTHALIPDKTDPPLVINADAILTGTSPLKRFEAVNRRNAEIVQVPGVIEHTGTITQCVIYIIPSGLDR